MRRRRILGGIAALVVGLGLVACDITPAQARSLCEQHRIAPTDPITYSVHEHATGGGGEAQAWVRCAAQASTDAGGVPSEHYYIYDIRTDVEPDQVGSPADYGTEPPPTPGAPAPPPCGGPITITAGGTYTGCYESTDPNVPAVRIATDQPVTIDNATIKQKGAGVVDTQNSPFRRERVTITDSVFLQSDPGALVHHRAVQLGAPHYFVFEHNRLVDTDGIHINSSNGAGGSHLVNPVSVKYNFAENIGRYPFPLTSGCCVQFLALDNVRETPGIQVQWNHVRNESGKSDLEGDVINLYESGGTVAVPADLSNNLVDGAYPDSPADTRWTGGGINLGDCCGGNAHGDIARNGNSHDNVVVSTTNYGVNANGFNNHAYNNLLVNDRFGSDGVTRFDSDFGAAASKFFASAEAPNTIHDNRYNWLRNDTDGQIGCVTQTGGCINNVQVSTTEQGARDEWYARRIAAGVVIGPRP